jgi:hypothetical protein
LSDPKAVGSYRDAVASARRGGWIPSPSASYLDAPSAMLREVSAQRPTRPLTRDTTCVRSAEKADWTHEWSAGHGCPDRYSESTSLPDRRKLNGGNPNTISSRRSAHPSEGVPISRQGATRQDVYSYPQCAGMPRVLDNSLPAPSGKSGAMRTRLSHRSRSIGRSGSSPLFCSDLCSAMRGRWAGA